MPIGAPLWVQSANALNLYLVDLRENRKLRSNESVRSVENGIVSEEPAPARLDCHYLISAWSPAEVSPAVEPALDEHALLYQAAAALLRHAPFNPGRVYPADSLPLNAWPDRLSERRPAGDGVAGRRIQQTGGILERHGPGRDLAPALYLIVTLPIALLTGIAGPMVTTRITEYRISEKPETAEVWIQIGGHVLSPVRLVAVGSATVTNIGATGSGNPVRVNSAAPFREGDTVTAVTISSRDDHTGRGQRFDFEQGTGHAGRW